MVKIPRDVDTPQNEIAGAKINFTLSVAVDSGAASSHHVTLAGQVGSHGDAHLAYSLLSAAVCLVRNLPVVVGMPLYPPFLQFLWLCYFHAAAIHADRFSPPCLRDCPHQCVPCMYPIPLIHMPCCGIATLPFSPTFSLCIHSAWRLVELLPHSFRPIHTPISSVNPVQVYLSLSIFTLSPWLPTLPR